MPRDLARVIGTEELAPGVELVVSEVVGGPLDGQTVWWIVSEDR